MQALVTRASFETIGDPRARPSLPGDVQDAGRVSLPEPRRRIKLDRPHHQPCGTWRVSSEPDHRACSSNQASLRRAMLARRYAESAGRPGAGGSIDQGWLKSCALLTSPPEGAGLCRAWLRERLAGSPAYRASSSAVTVSTTASRMPNVTSNQNESPADADKTSDTGSGRWTTGSGRWTRIEDSWVVGKRV